MADSDCSEDYDADDFFQQSGLAWANQKTMFKLQQLEESKG